MTTTPTPAESSTRRRKGPLLAILALCLAPVIASYVAYYLVKPDGRTNYGELIEPLRATDDLVVREANGAAASLTAVRGKWVLLTVDARGCDAPCAARLYAMRQVRLTTGKERDRIERVLLVSGEATPAAAVLAEHEGLRVYRVQGAPVRWLPPADGGTPEDHIYVVDPMGNVMLRFPKSVDPNRMKKDIARLLKASRVG